MDQKLVLSSRVRLERNYNDLPFDLSGNSENAEICINRTLNALTLAGLRDEWHLLPFSELTPTQQKTMVYMHMISPRHLRMADSLAILMHNNNRQSIVLNGDVHLRIQAILPGVKLSEAANACFKVEDALSRQVHFAFDEELGYLTAEPTNTGTGMRASLLMHLPLLTWNKQMGEVNSIVSKMGMTIRGVYGEGTEALGNIFLIGNQVTLGRTEQEILSTVLAVGEQLGEMEMSLRTRDFAKPDASLEDRIYRAWGLLCNARLLDLSEFYRAWSAVRLGASMGMLSIGLDELDRLLSAVQPESLEIAAQRTLDETQCRLVRACLVRSVMDGTSAGFSLGQSFTIC